MPRILLCFLMLLFASHVCICQKPNLIVKASRTTGTAPLAVYFDATFTTISGRDAFRDMTYSFNFGDMYCGNWSIDGKPKNLQVGGPISAHVYDNAGTYTVKIRASAPGGYFSDASLTIQVSDPNVDFAGNKTVCVSNIGNYAGCPSGALKQTTVPTDTQWSGKRWLFRKGESFGALSIQDGNSQVQVGAYGTSSQPPIVSSVGVGSWRPNTPKFPVDVTVMDLAITVGITNNLGKRHLFYRNNITGCDGAGVLCVGFGEPYYWIFDDPYRFVDISDFYNPHEMFYVDNIVVGTTQTSQGNFFGSVAKSAFMGNYVKNSRYHNLRCTACYKVFFGHNWFGGVSIDGGYHSFKMHSSSTNDTLWYNDNSTLSTAKWITQYNVISNNILGSKEDNNVWVSMISPQNGAYAERITDIIIENNQYIIHRDDQTDLIMAARNVTYRGNTRSNGKSAVVMFNSHGEALPSYWLGPYYNTSTPEVNVVVASSSPTPNNPNNNSTSPVSSVKGKNSSDRVSESFHVKYSVILMISLIISALLA